MSSVKIATVVRTGTAFVAIEDVARYDGDPDYVLGAASLMIDGVEVIVRDDMIKTAYPVGIP